jgi:glyoxylase-like metal-dependent hydrolase (beta-lactamase superfamily II)
MTAQLFAFTGGHVTGAREGFLEGELGSFRVPVPVYLIVHPQGKVLFDTGLNLAIRQEKARLLGPADADWEIDFPAADEIVPQLARLGIAPPDIRYVVNSHLHFDHCGGNAQFPDATLIVHAREWRAAQRPALHAAGIYNPLDFDHMKSVRQVDGELDLFGDGSVVVFPTPGHTPGHQSLRVTTGSGVVVLAADCCYLKQTLDAAHLPKNAYNKDQMRASLDLLRGFQNDGARIFFGHDPEFWKTVPQAPHPVA